MRVAPDVALVTAVSDPHLLASGTLPRVASQTSSKPFVRRITRQYGWRSRMLWLGIVLVHAVCGAFYISMAYVYARLPETLLMVNLQAFELTIDKKHFPVAVVFHAIYATLHVISFLTMTLSSIVHRGLVFKLPERRNAGTNRWVLLVRRLWDSTFGPLGFFGVDHYNFEVLFALRELVETGLQSLQAYRMSQYVPRVWLNNFWVAIIAINCWGTPLLRRFSRYRRRTQLLLALLCDVLLDFMSSVGTPVVLAMSYLPDYDPASQDFIADVWYSDLWFVNMVNEVQLVFIQSPYDFFTRAAFAASLLLCLDDIKILVSTNEPPDTSRKSVSKSSFTLTSDLTAARHTIIKFAHSIMAVWGIFVVGFHLQASFGSAVQGCQLQVRPWASPKTACSFLLIDCQAPGSEIQGLASEIEGMWENANPEMLSLLTIQNCPSLDIPSGVQQLKRLMGFNVLSSTIVAWDDDAAFTNAKHPNIRHLGLLWVNFSHFGNGNGSELPPGLMSPDFPVTLFDIFVMECGWIDLPSHLDKIWPKRTNLLLPMNGMSTIPDVVFRMEPIRLMLDGNPLEHLPRQVFELVTLQSIEVPFAPLFDLPNVASGLPVASQLAHLNIQGTNISLLPAWMTKDVFLGRVRLRAEGTPLCTRILNQDPAVTTIAGRISC